MLSDREALAASWAHTDGSALFRLLCETELHLGLMSDSELRRSWNGYARRTAGHTQDTKGTAPCGKR